jgi:hypothetical protein
MMRSNNKSQHQRRGTGVALGALCLVVLSPFLGIPLIASAATPSPVSLLTTALRDALAGGWVHEVEVSTANGTSAKYIDEVGTAEGRQEIALSNGVHVQVIAFDQRKRMYIRANALGISSFLGISKTQPGQYANKWLIVTPQNTNYSVVASDTTLKSDFDSQLSYSGKVTRGSNTTISGTHVAALEWTIPKSKNYPAVAVTLYVTALGATLPVEMSEKSTSGDYVVQWSKWGRAVALAAPKGAEPMPISPTGEAA